MSETAPIAADHQLAQLDVARLRAPLDTPMLAGFVANLAPVNALADAAPGFVWRLQTEDGDATAVRILDDDMLIVNMSVWTSLEALRDFVYRSGHVDVMRRRREWFERLGEAFSRCGGSRRATVPLSPRPRSDCWPCAQRDRPRARSRSHAPSRLRAIRSRSAATTRRPARPDDRRLPSWR